MLIDSIIGLVAAIVVISSVAWVSQYRKIRDRIRAKKKAARIHQNLANAA
jgi:hypothetical protein